MYICLLTSYITSTNKTEISGSECENLVCGSNMGETINKNRDCSKLAVGLIWKMGGERERVPMEIAED